MPGTIWAAKDHALEEQNEQKSSQSKYKNALEPGKYGQREIKGNDTSTAQCS